MSRCRTQLTLMMTSTQEVETSINVITNSPSHTEEGLFTHMSRNIDSVPLQVVGQVVPYNSTLNHGNYRKHRLSKQRPQHLFELILHCCLYFSRCSCSIVKLTTLPPTTKIPMDLRTKKMTSDLMCSSCRQ